MKFERVLGDVKERKKFFRDRLSNIFLAFYVFINSFNC